MRPASAGDPVPEAVLSALGGSIDAANEAITVTTVDEDGWPRTALLSLGELVLTGRGRIAVLLHDGSTGAANLRRDGRLLVTLAAGGNVYDLKFRVQERGPVLVDPQRATFIGKLRAVREQRAAYATVTSGIRFTLDGPHTVLPRWQDQLAHLRACLELPRSSPPEAP